MTNKQLQNIIEMAGYETRTYSGRGMYGKECLAFDTQDSVIEVAASLFETVLDTENAADFINTFRKIKTDSLGRGTVFYFPSMSVDGLRFEEAEDEGDAPGEGNPAQWR